MSKKSPDVWLVSTIMNKNHFVFKLWELQILWFCCQQEILRSFRPNHCGKGFMQKRIGTEEKKENKCRFDIKTT